MTNFTDELKARILGNSVMPFENAFHGYVVLIGEDKIFKNCSGVCIFSSEDQARQSFYTTYRNVVKTEVSEGLGTWTEFKRAIQYRIIQI